VGRASATLPVDFDLTPFPDSRSVSRHHARIALRDGAHWLSEEPGVSNGTFVNRQRLVAGEPRRLGDGDKVRFGRVVARFRS
jgi:predicted component of type VI protein secretion system